MAYHLSILAISRGKCRSAAGACAYIAAGVAEDDWTGMRMDYRRKARPESITYIGTSARNPHDFAHALDSKEVRKNSVVAREIVLALPDSALAAVRQQIAEDVASWLSARYDVPVLCVIHKPSRQGDQRNHHAHLVMGTRDSSGAKIRVLDDLKRGPEEIIKIRAYASERICAQVPPEERQKWSHESLLTRGVHREATRHEGPMLTGMRRKKLSPKLFTAIHNDTIKSEINDSTTINAKENTSLRAPNIVTQNSKHIQTKNKKHERRTERKFGI